MTNVKFPRKEFEKHIKLTPENIEKISLFGTPLESLNDDEIEIEIFPNRPDLLSMHLYIKSFLSYLGKNSGLKKYSVKKPEKNFEIKVESSVKNVRPCVVCAIIKNLSLNEDKIKEIIGLQEKLHLTLGRNRRKFAIGIYPLEKISLPIIYKALPPEKINFVPLESGKEINAKQILQKHPKGKEYSHLLSDFDVYPVFVDSKNNILSMPPIINSNETGKVAESTRDVFIECSGNDLNILKKTLNIIVVMLAEMNGKIYQMTIDYNGKKIITPDLTPKRMRISLENTNKLLGLNLKESELQNSLSRMGFEYKNKNVLIPQWRTDILHEVDLIEDIAIAYGYNNFSPIIPNVSTIGGESKESEIINKISDLLIGLGLIEIKSYHLIKLKEAELMKFNEIIELDNSKTEYKILRPNLLIPALKFLSENKDNDYPQEIFEIGTVFSLDKKDEFETGIEEKENLLILSSPSNFTKMKQIFGCLFETLNLEYEIKESSHSELIEGRTAAIFIENKEIGYFGEIHPETLNSWNIKMPASVLEISLEQIFDFLTKNSL